MLFNSYGFIFAFLPLTLVVFYVLGRYSSGWAQGWLILASFCFYAWWRPFNVLLIAPSILINYVLARVLLALRDDPQRRMTSTAVLLLGIAFNVAFLGYFKYKAFFVEAINDMFGANLAVARVILPLGISFITFQKIAFLIDVQGRRVDAFTLREYCLFVLFFPQLIAGPIVHFREMMPQFRGAACRFDINNASVGLAIFSLGLFKKVVFADGIAPYVSAIFERAGGGGSVSLIPAWMAAIGFTLQIYFDFSGYSDMAIGLGRFFGVRLPANFDSPLRASSVIDYWLRWHITLTRFLTAYIYNPLTLALTRRWLARGRPAYGGRNTTTGAFVCLLLFPTVLTMLISGLWHGAGYMFIVWGGLHGIYLSVNHAWRLVGPRLWKDRASYVRTMRPVGWVLTFLAVTIAMVFFRATSMKAAATILSGMVAGYGIALPTAVLGHLGPAAAWFSSPTPESWWSADAFAAAAAWIAALLAVALLFPNTLQLLKRYEPALGMRPASGGTASWLSRIEWAPSVVWATVISVAAAAAILRLGGPSEFLYWQF